MPNPLRTLHVGARHMQNAPSLLYESKAFVVLQGDAEPLPQHGGGRVGVGNVQNVEAGVAGGQRGLSLRGALDRQPAALVIADSSRQYYV